MSNPDLGLILTDSTCFLAPCYPAHVVRCVIFWRPCVSQADWCLNSDGVPASRLQNAASC